MPFRKTYEINNREQGKAAQRDQSYRSCIIALLIFFFMCLILILACIPWKTRNQKEYKNHYVDPQYHHGRLPTASTTQTTTPRTTIITPNTKNTSTELDYDNQGIITEQSSQENDKGSHPFERYYENGTTKNIFNPATTFDNDVEEYTTTPKKSLQYIEHDVVTGIVIDDNITSMSPHGSIDKTTLKYNVIEHSTTSEIVKETTTDRYHSSKKSEFDVTTDNTITSISSTQSDDLEKNIIFAKNSTNKNERLKTDVTDNVTSSTLSTPLDDLEENAAKKSTKKYERLEIYVTTDNKSLTTSNPMTNFEKSTNAKYTEKSQFDVTKSNMINSMSPTPLDFEEDKDTKSFIDKHEKLKIDVTDNVTSSTLSTPLDDLEENAAKKSTKKYERLEIYVTTDKSLTTPNPLTNFEESTNAKYMKKSQFNVTKNNMIGSTLPNRFEDKDAESSTNKYTNYEKSTITEYNTTSKTQQVTRKNFSAMEKYNVSFTNHHANATTTSTFYNYTISITVPINQNETNPTTTEETILPDEDANICETGHCKQIASKMLSYMNHSADPCDDFYEYACGGFEVDQLTDKDLLQKSRNYQRIARQMLKEKHENVHSTFATYYDSCVQYEKTVNFNERIKMASDALREMGEFYTNATWPDHYVNFTNLFAKLILHHSALLFDVVPELDEYNPNHYILKISPMMYESAFIETEHTEDPCFENEFETKEQYVDLEVLYNNYKRCKNNTKEFMRSIKEALTVFKDLNIESEYIEKTVHVIDSIIMQGYFSHFPSKNEIRETYLMNNYSRINLKNLQSSITFVNWMQLFRSLTKMDMIYDEKIQVYFLATLTEGLGRLEDFAKEDPIGLNNAIMGLYAHKLYHEFVLPKHNNVKDYCLQMVTHLLRLEASSLYISSFADHEITRMNTITKKIFNKMKQTLKLNIEEAQWAKEKGKQALLEKIDNLEFTLPIVSYFKNRNLLYSEYDMPQIILYDNYFNNSIILLKRYRTLMYAELRRQVDDPKRIWTYYATPFQSKAQSIYVLNLIVIPYGIVDWSSINDDPSFDYLLLATLGNLIAHQIAHHFDAKGICYWNRTRDAVPLTYENDFTTVNFDDYINCQKENLYQGPMNMILPFTDQTVSLTIPRLTLNERLSEIMGLRLAYDTLALTKSNAKQRLPWIKLRINQLFYLAYAQTYCTKTPLTSSYVSLYENENLPSRIRVFVSASNNILVAKEWNCPAGSHIAPNDVCSVFPYIDYKVTFLGPE